MKNSFLILMILLTAVSANSQALKSKRVSKPKRVLIQKLFSEVFKENKNFCDTNKKIERAILYEYGAVYVSKAFISRNAGFPLACRLNDDSVNSFIRVLTEGNTGKLPFGEFYIHPQAKIALLSVFNKLNVFNESDVYKYVARNCNGTVSCDKANNKDINNDWALRTYAETKTNWENKRLGENEGGKDEIGYIENALEDKYSDSVKPRIYDYAIPGGSQHHLGLAIDVNNKSTRRVCGDACVKALESSGWFRTVRYDPFHYTYLGFTERQLPSRGLKKVQCRDTFTYWVPNVPEYKGYKNWECNIVK